MSLCDWALMNLRNAGTLKSLFVPGGVLLLAAVALLQGGFVSLSPAAIDFYYFAVFGAGVLLAWRFHASRVLFALFTLFLAHRAVVFFSAGKVAATGPGHIAFETVALLLPLNFIVFSAARERGWGIPAALPRLALLFFEAVLVAILCRPGTASSPVLVRFPILSPSLFRWTHIPQLALLAFFAAAVVLLMRVMLYRKPVESGLFWSLVAIFLALQANGIGRLATAYWATAGLLLLTSIIENSYVLAYHDELTSLPARRAFNEALLRLEAPYAIAAVDIDHFKSFNDTYGHDTGDEVLRMVAGRLARVGGGGQMFRVGGEEFSILFPGKTTKEVLPHLETLRALIEDSSFRVRGTPERRRAPRTSGRRVEDKLGSRRRRRTSLRAMESSSGLSVTVSIGVAEPGTATTEVEQVIQAADKALYRAKKAGRNRVETAIESHGRGSRSRRNIA